MIYNSPFFSTPYYRRPRSINYYPFANNYSVPYYNNGNKKANTFPTQKNNNELPKEEKRKKESVENEFFEIFGIKLCFDDILLICLIFFLYNEGVKDQYLFISLILLLLT